MANIQETETFRTVRENDPANGVRRFWDALAVAFDGGAERSTTAILYAHENGVDQDLVTDALEAMTDGYLEALLWTSVTDESAENGGDETYLDAGFDAYDVTPEFRARVLDHLLSVVVAHPLAVRLYGSRRVLPDGASFQPHGVVVAQDGGWDYFGHDYLLTRDGHGVGFWDRGLGELGDYLTDVAKGNGGSEHANGSLQLAADGQIDG